MDKQAPTTPRSRPQVISPLSASCSPSEDSYELQSRYSFVYSYDVNIVVT